MSRVFPKPGMSYEWAWASPRSAVILPVAAVPLMLAVAMIIYADRKTAAIALRRGLDVAGLRCCRASPTAWKCSCRKRSSRRAPTGAVPDRADHHLHRGVDGVGGDRPPAWCSPTSMSGHYILAISSLGVYGVIRSGLAARTPADLFPHCAPRRR